MMAFTVAAVPVSAATAAPAFAATAAPRSAIGAVLHNGRAAAATEATATAAIERLGGATTTERPRCATTTTAIKMRAGRAATTTCTNTAASGAPADTGILGEACGRRGHRQNHGHYGSGTQHLKTDHYRLHLRDTI